MDEMSLLMEWLCVWLQMFVNEKAFVKDRCKCNECISVQLFAAHMEQQENIL